MSSFLSANLQRNVANLDLDGDSCDGEVKLLFEITADPTHAGDVQACANISQDLVNIQKSEKCFLWLVVFCYVTDAINGDLFLTVKLELSSEVPKDLKPICEILTNEYGDEQIGKARRISFNSLDIILFNLQR
ncbi:unnamed protein product [Rotaria magnacalcarata]|uniref:Uncharacterized protein n=1 Tax=Rotaria magnacalcarata TaxID=392030 RepID=A0A816VTM0_9BILA|nr:unnamed protein product [Rotaria magnacalcarata]CAF2198422.1 unnamed protein product [Rotaria magnacalcarata]CAF3935696.1 unnamed protein product [Rotaria magnacalcarata]CAF4025048.1 unnamed protein product [Rotaria magnacalcarata]